MPNAQDAFRSETPSDSQVTLKGSYMHFLGEGKQVWVSGVVLHFEECTRTCKTAVCRWCNVYTCI